MNEIARVAVPQDEVIRVLGSSLYPGAKPESIALVLSYCRVNGLDPMLKPVHIVPTSVKLPSGKYEMRDVLMPGIADYRIKASRSGEYAGKSDPEFGPDVTEALGGVTVTYPQWCRVTVKRIVQGEARDFTATERWLENYATAGRDTDAPNKMWKKRAYGQIAKCAEAQALRQAFPEFSGGAPTAEEMEGKTLDDFSGPTIDGKATAAPADTRSPWIRELEAKLTAEKNGAKWLTLLRREITAAPTREDVEAAAEISQVQGALESAPEPIRKQIEDTLADAIARFELSSKEDDASAPTIEGSATDGDVAANPAADFIGTLLSLDILALNKLGTDAQHRVKMKEFDPDGQRQINEWIDARKAELRVAA